LFKKLNILKTVKGFEIIKSFPSCAEKAECFDIRMVSVAEGMLKLLRAKKVKNLDLNDPAETACECCKLCKFVAEFS